MVDEEHSANSTDSDPEPIRAKAYTGQVLGERYRVLGALGSGGMGTVFLARHTILRKLVAIKVLDCTQLTGADAASRLFREAQAAAAIGHPNIIDVVDVGVSALGDPYLVMEYLDGEDLGSLVARAGPLDVATACAVIEPVLRGLAAAHELNIVHRDVKPQNIFVARKPGGGTHVKLIDFGVAKVTTPGLSPLTRSGQVLGTPSFMSPEQAIGAEVDTRSDIYSVGVILHQLLTGKTPYGEANYHALLHRIATGEPTLATEQLDPYVGSVILHCMQKDPHARPQSATELLKGLARIGEWEQREFALRELGHRLVTQLDVASLDVSEFNDDHHSRLSSGPVTTDEPRLLPAPEHAQTKLAAQTGLEATMATPGASAAPPPPPSAPGPKKPWVVLAAVVLVALAGGVWLGGHSTGDADEPRLPLDRAPAAPVVAIVATLPPAAPATTGPAVSDTVQIHVEGLPEDATVTFGGQAVEGNPFRTAHALDPVPLRIERAGYRPMEAAIVPDRDRVIRARLTRRAAMVTRPQPPPDPSSSGDTSPSVPTMGRSGRDSHYSERFE